MNDNITDTDLLDRARERDLDAMEELLRRHEPSIRKAIDINPRWRAALSPDDVFQVTCIEAFLGIGCFRSDAGAFPKWLKRIAVRNMLNAIRWLERHGGPHARPRARGNGEGDGDGESEDEGEVDPIMSLYMQVSGSQATPSGRVNRADAIRLLEAEVAELPEDYANVVRLTFFQGLTIPDAARALRRSYGAVYMSQRRALEHLAMRMGGDSDSR